MKQNSLILYVLVYGCLCHANMFALPTKYDPQKRIWSGPSRENFIYGEDVSVGKIMFNTMKNWPRNVCQIMDIDDVEVTFQQCQTWAIRIAQHLKKRGYNHRDIIGIVAKNTTYVMPLAVACFMNTTTFHAINSMLDEATIRHVYGVTKPQLIFCDGHDYRKIQAATNGWHPEIYTLTDAITGVPHIDQLLEPTGTEMFYIPEPLKLGGEQTVAILCSSGTTGMPKAVCISNKILTVEAPFNSEFVMYTSSSVDWITGLWACVFSATIGCTRIITTQPFSPEYFLRLVKKYKINYAALPPRYLSALSTCPEATQESLASLKFIFYTGSLISLSTLQRIQQLCKGAIITSGYGMTETGGVSSNFGLGNITSAGKIIPGVKVCIVDKAGQRLTYNEVGEILVHTGSSWNGYYGNPVETQRMYDFQGWFHTGDLGYFDEQDYLYISGRNKENLKYMGYHYWPSEIEATISELPQVQDVCVVGVYDERHGDAAGALVVRREGSDISAAEIQEHVASRLTLPQKQLHAGVRFTNKLPTNPNGKTLRKVALEMFVAQN